MRKRASPEKETGLEPPKSRVDRTLDSSSSKGGREAESVGLAMASGADPVVTVGGGGVGGVGHGLGGRSGRNRRGGGGSGRPNRVGDGFGPCKVRACQPCGAVH